MIELVYRKEDGDLQHQDTGFKLPKNIRQIGGGDTDIQVYMEDNVALYLSKVPDREEDIRYGVLLGQVKRSCGYTYIFINGAVDVREVFDNTVIFSDEIWTTINDDIYRYFQGQKVVGWFLSQNYANSNQNIWIKKMHLNNFAGMDKVFFRMDRDDDDEAFYYYGSDNIEKLPCYHIYYEKNNAMTEYMMETNADIKFKRPIYERKAEEIKAGIEEKAVNEAIIKENSEMVDRGRTISSYTNALSRVASILVIGALTVTIGVMGMGGKFDNLTGELKSIVNGIMNGGDEAVNGDGIISVNGTVNNQNTTTGAEAESTEADTTTEPSGETTTSQETTSQSQEETTTIESESAAVKPAVTKEYMVEKGETLYSICMKLYGNLNNMSTIMELNHLESGDAIYYGKNLIVP